MPHLTRADLMSLETYARERAAFRAKVIAHKKDRRVALGPNANLYFEDRLTMQYQVQEMLRIERIFEPEAIEEELAAYNPLIPDGDNWKATFMVEYGDAKERKVPLSKSIGVEDRVYVRVEGHDKAYAVADEDMPRENEDKTSSVHFMRFQLDAAMVKSAKAGAALFVGVDHEHLNREDRVTENIRVGLMADLA